MSSPNSNPSLSTGYTTIVKGPAKLRVREKITLDTAMEITAEDTDYTISL